MSKNNEKSTLDPTVALQSNEDDERAPLGGRDAESLGLPDLVAVPAALAGSGSLDRLVDTAREYARQATADNTNAAYKAD